MKIDISNLDCIRFGVMTAKAKIEKGDSVEVLVHQAESLGVEFLIVRLSTNEIALCQQLEGRNAFLADTLVYYQKKKIDEYKITLAGGYFVTDAGVNDADQVEQVAGLSFKGYFGHYHADPHLSQTACDAVYSSWARNSCLQPTVADAVILIRNEAEIAAFATVKKINVTDFEGVLFGVAPSHRGKGMHLNLIKISENWGIRNERKRFISSTQINNVVVQKNWCHSGMEPFESFYTFHLWINK